MIRIQHHDYYGMSGPVTTFTDPEESDARACVARFLRKMRRKGFIVTILARGAQWKIDVSDNCAMVPDACGVLRLTR